MKYNRPSLVDNIFVNIYGKEIHCGNITEKLNYQKYEQQITNLKKVKITDMKNFDKTKHLNDIKEQDSLNIYQHKDVELEPWISSSILKSIKTKNIYYKKFLKSQSKLW